MSSLEVRANLVLSARAGRPYEKRNDKGELSYTMRNLQGDGMLYVGSAAQSGLDDEATPGVDCIPVHELDLLAFKQGTVDELFDGLSSLQRGDRVNVWFSIEYTRTSDSAGRVRMGTRWGRIVGVEVVERAPEVSTRARGFVDAVGAPAATR